MASTTMNEEQVHAIKFLSFLVAWSLGNPLADWNGDGDISTLEFLAYLAAAREARIAEGSPGHASNTAARSGTVGGRGGV